MPTFFARRGTGLRKAITSLRVGHVYFDVGRRTVFCLNETARQLMQEGVPFSREDLERRPLRTLAGEPVDPDEWPLLRAWRSAAPKEAVFLYTGPDGVVRHLTWSASPLADPGGPVRAVLGSVVVAPPEPDWQQLAGLAHDLRTPLQALRLLGPSLEGTPGLPAETRAQLERIRGSTERTLAIGMDLLEWARGPALGGRRVDRAWFPVAPLLESLAGEHLVHANQKSIALATDLDAARKLEVHSDSVRLGRLLSNLITNAVRYTPRGEVRLSASWRVLAGRPAFFVLGVEDTGNGLSPEDQESIFQPFERGKAGKDSDASGSGLGLAVVDQLVEELGLTLEIFSEYGHGSKFEVVLPPGDVRVAPPAK